MLYMAWIYDICTNYTQDKKPAFSCAFEKIETKDFESKNQKYTLLVYLLLSVLFSEFFPSNVTYSQKDDYFYPV